MRDLLWIKVQMSSIYLVEPPKEIFGCTVDVVAAGIIGKVIAQW